MTPISYGSVCSGIEAATVAWAPLCWKAVWFAEIEAFRLPCSRTTYPNVPNLGDMTTLARRILAGEVEAPDVLVGGTPCQAFSVAGGRMSLDDARGNLTLHFVELVNAIDFVRRRAGKPPVIVTWENVPGVLSTRDNAFGCFLGGLAGEDGPLFPAGPKWSHAGCVYGPARAIAWRTLDAQYFGLAQRRPRVFVVASAADGFDPAQVLLEWEGVRRDSAPRRTAGEGAAAALAASARHHGYSSPRGDGSDNLVAATLVGKMAGDQEGRESHLVAYGGNDTSGLIDVATARNAHGGHRGMDDDQRTTRCDLAQQRMPIPMLAKDRCIFVHQTGGPLKKSSFDSAFQRLMKLAIEEGVMTEAQRFGPHDLKRKGITDTKGTRGEKQQASGHKSQQMLDV